MSDWTEYVYKSLYSNGMGELDLMINIPEKKKNKWRFWE